MRVEYINAFPLQVEYGDPVFPFAVPGELAANHPGQVSPIWRPGGVAEGEVWKIIETKLSVVKGCWTCFQLVEPGGEDSIFLRVFIPVGIGDRLTIW